MGRHDKKHKHGCGNREQLDTTQYVSEDSDGNHRAFSRRGSSYRLHTNRSNSGCSHKNRGSCSRYNCTYRQSLVEGDSQNRGSSSRSNRVSRCSPSGRGPVCSDSSFSNNRKSRRHRASSSGTRMRTGCIGECAEDESSDSPERAPWSPPSSRRQYKRKNVKKERKALMRGNRGDMSESGDEIPFKCPECNFVAMTGYELAIHKRVKHGRDMDSW